MANLLHLTTRQDDTLARDVIRNQVQAGQDNVRQIDLTSAQIDYDLVVEAIFAADSVQVW